jgi:large subunit ribosomal protein L4
MPTIDVRKADGSIDGSVDLPADVFDVQANLPLMHQVVVAQQAAARQGTHSTKTRGEVSGGGKKPYRQKGTGRARQGSTRAPQFAGGGVVHGPTPRNYSQRTPKKMKAAALRGALSDRARADRVHVVDSFSDGGTPSTKTATAALLATVQSRKVLVVLARDDVAAWKSLRNVPAVHLIEAGQLNTYDVLVSDDVVFSRSGLDAFLARTGHKELPDLSTADIPGEPIPSMAPATGTTDTDTEDDADDADAPYGAGSHAALADGGQPDGFPIKGNADSMLYHVPDSPFYDRTEAEVWFATAEDAERAGFQLPPSQRDDAEEEK